MLVYIEKSVNLAAVWYKSYKKEIIDYNKIFFCLALQTTKTCFSTLDTFSKNSHTLEMDFIRIYLEMTIVGLFLFIKNY